MRAILTYEMSSKSVTLNLYLKSDDREEIEYLSSQFNKKDKGYIVAFDVIPLDDIEKIEETINKWVGIVNREQSEFRELQAKKEKVRKLLTNQYHFVVEEE